MNPALKKALSAVAFAVATALLVALKDNLLPHLPEPLHMIGAAVFTAAAHYLNAWGHQERVDEKVTEKVEAVVSQEASSLDREALVQALLKGPK